MIVAIADHGSLRRAAAASGQTVAAISKKLRALEDRIGLPLFVRTASGVQATPAGERMAADGRRILADIDTALDAVIAHAPPAGRVVIGAGPLAAWAVATGLNPAVHARWPNVQIEVQTGYPEDLLVRLQKGAIDFAICHLEDQILPSSLVAQPLLHLLPAFLARAGHPLAGRVRIGGSALAPFGFVGSRSYGSNLLWLESLIGAPPRFEFISSDYALVSDIVANSDHICVTSQGLARKLGADRGHVILDVTAPPFVHKAWLIEPAAGTAPAARRVVQLAIELLACDERQQTASTSG